MSGILETSVRLTIPFHDVDPAGLVWHGNYFRYLEQARCDLLESIGYNYRHMAASGLMWPLTDVSCRFQKPIRYHDEVLVTARLTEWEYRMVFEYEIRDPGGRTLATARTVQVPVRLDSGELVIGSDVFEQRVQQALAQRSKANE